MNAPLTLAQHRASVSHDDLAFCVQLPLYTLIERQPRPGEPGYIEVYCLQVDDIQGMMAFLSPLDAMMRLQEENQRGRHYELCPFELIDPRPFMEAHYGELHLFVVYGYAGHDDKLLLNKRGNLLPLSKYMGFQVQDYADQHFHLHFEPAFHDWFNQQLRQAGMHDYGSINEELTETPLTEIEYMALDALQASERTEGEITQCAFYDSVEQCWRFINYSDPNELAFARC
jgi:hypothetical protein